MVMSNMREFGFGPKYLVSEDGVVVGPSGRALKFFKTAKGYMCQAICGKTVRLHRAVATAFVPNPDNLPEVNHIDGDKLNNRASNLEWATHKQNMEHAYRTGLARNGFGEDALRSKLTQEQVNEIRRTYIRGDKQFGQYALGRKFGVTNSCVWRIIHGDNWAQS